MLIKLGLHLFLDRVLLLNVLRREVVLLLVRFCWNLVLVLRVRCRPSRGLRSSGSDQRRLFLLLLRWLCRHRDCEVRLDRVVGWLFVWLCCLGMSLLESARRLISSSNLDFLRGLVGSRRVRLGIALTDRKRVDRGEVVWVLGFLALLKLYSTEWRILWLTSWSLRPLNIQNHVYRLVYLNDTFRFVFRTNGTNVDGHSLPGGVEQFVTVK